MKRYQVRVRIRNSETWEVAYRTDDEDAAFAWLETQLTNPNISHIKVHDTHGDEDNPAEG